MTTEEFINATRMLQAEQLAGFQALLDQYFIPFFWVLGAICAVVVIGSAVAIVILPWLRKVF